LFDKIKNGQSFKTSSTPLGILINKIEEMLEKYEKVVFFPICAGLSTQYNAAKMIEEDYNGRFVVVKTVSAVLTTK
jgi:fatty acid-binding protein DegV